MPVIFANFGTFSPVSFLANAVILPLVPYAMLLSAITGAAGLASPFLGNLFAFPAYATIRPIILGTEYMAVLSRRVMIRAEFGWASSFVWYLSLWVALRFSYLAMRYRGGYPGAGPSFSGMLAFLKTESLSSISRFVKAESKATDPDGSSGTE